MAEVVVLPFVAEMTAVPAGRRAARRSIAPGVELREELAGHGHPCAGADEARERGDSARGTNLDGQTHRPRVRDIRGNSFE